MREWGGDRPTSRARRGMDNSSTVPTFGDGLWVGSALLDATQNASNHSRYASECSQKKPPQPISLAQRLSCGSPPPATVPLPSPPSPPTPAPIAFRGIGNTCHPATRRKGIPPQLSSSYKCCRFRWRWRHGTPLVPSHDGTLPPSPHNADGRAILTRVARNRPWFPNETSCNIAGILKEEQCAYVTGVPACISGSRIPYLEFPYCALGNVSCCRRSGFPRRTAVRSLSPSLPPPTTFFPRDSINAMLFHRYKRQTFAPLRWC